jgi:hypothetical protein
MAAADPVLAELWDNPKDAEYDRRRLGTLDTDDLDAFDQELRRSLGL